MQILNAFLRYNQCLRCYQLPTGIATNRGNGIFNLRYQSTTEKIKFSHSSNKERQDESPASILKVPKFDRIWLDPISITRKRAEEEERRLQTDPEAVEGMARFADLEKRMDEMWEQYGEELDEDGSLLGKDMFRDSQNEPDIREMVTGDETASKPINRFRKILYAEGELDQSDLQKPPSRTNPHPLDTSALPPTHSRSITAYANHLPVIQMLLELGVNLFEVDKLPKIGRALVRLDLESEVKPKIYWLVRNVGIPEEELGSYLSRNPYILFQKMAELKDRLDYLKSKRFSRRQIVKIVTESRFWLNTPKEDIDGRLGWLTRQFFLRADELRLVLVKEPRVIAFGVGPIQGIYVALNKDCGFSAKQLQRILLMDPRLFLVDKPKILVSFNYLAYVMRIENDQIAKCPSALRCPIWALRRRHEFLHRLRKANYLPNTPGFISLEQLIHPSDRYFAEDIARVMIADYNRFIKFV